MNDDDKKQLSLRDLGYTKEQAEILTNTKPDPNITIVGYCTTMKSPLLKKMLENLEKLEKDKP